MKDLFESYYILCEAKADQEKLVNFVGQEYADKFFNLKNRLKTPENDIYYWLKKEPDELKSTIDRLENTKTNKQLDDEAKKGAKLIYQDSDWLVYHITTFEASKKYGANTKWCITGKNLQGEDTYGNKYWNEYTNDGVDFYFYINRKDNKKYALALYSDDTDKCEIYNEQDKQIDKIPNAPHIDGIPDADEFIMSLKDGIKSALKLKDSDVIASVQPSNVMLYDEDKRYFAVEINDDDKHPRFIQVDNDDTSWVDEIPGNADTLEGSFLETIYKKNNGNMSDFADEISNISSMLMFWELDDDVLRCILDKFVKDLKNNQVEQTYEIYYETLKNIDASDCKTFEDAWNKYQNWTFKPKGNSSSNDGVLEQDIRDYLSWVDRNNHYSNASKYVTSDELFDYFKNYYLDKEYQDINDSNYNQVREVWDELENRIKNILNKIRK